MIKLKSPAEIDMLAQPGAVVAQALAAVRAYAAVGVSLREWDTVAADVISGAGATPAFLNHKPKFAATGFPGVICASVNDAVVHGIPTDYRISDGDLVSIDCGAFVDGWCGDAAISFVVGAADDDLALVEATREALHAGIAAAVVGNRLGDIAAAISAVGRGAGYGLLEHHGGHGIGRAMREEPFVANEGKAGHGYRLRPGLVIAIEPMFLAGGDDEFRIDSDGWTVRSDDGSRAAHFEHTIAVTADGPRILTAV